MSRQKRAAAALTRSQALRCIPVKAGAVQEARLESGDILLTYPDYNQPWFARLFRGLGSPGRCSARIKKLQLDALGACVWELIDGKRSVQKVIDLFADRYRLHPKEAEVSVSQFLRELGRRELIGLR